ncbi:MAG TPA: amidase [Acidimicrobiia bacterium]|nr:amidase [Acidimicrobiia bacterium]
MDDLAFVDATAQAELVRAGDASPSELVDAAIARIEAVDPVLNAVVMRRFEEARAEAEAMSAPDAPDAPFRGVPFLTKDLHCTTAGEPDSEGSRFLKEAGYLATVTTSLAARYRQAGFVNLGRTNSPELGLVPTTEPEAWGATHNPWDLGRSPGGSSGGSAAAVAAGLVPVAHASDGGGSIRIPAAACGLVGLKPSRGRVSSGPVGGELFKVLSVQHVVTRTVRDCAALLDVAAGPEPGDPIVAPAPAAPFGAQVGADPGRLRVGLLTQMPGRSEATDPECVAAAEAAGALLESLGHEVEPTDGGFLHYEGLMAGFGTLWAVNTATALAAWGREVGRAVTAEDVEPLTWTLAERGRGVDAVTYAETLTDIQTACRRIMAWWTDHDLLLTPALGEPPVPLGTFAPVDGDVFAGYVRAGRFTPFTGFANMTGQPALALPIGTTASGLPLGVQLVAAYGREDVLLRVAARVEEARPWADRRPPRGFGNPP